MARRFIPKSIAECSPAWLTEVLRAEQVLKHATVEDVEVEILGEGEGFMGTVARLHLKLDADEAGAPGSLIAKIPTGDRSIRIEGELLGIYEREVFFARDFAKLLPVPSPRSYFSAMDPNPSTPERQAYWR